MLHLRKDVLLTLFIYLIHGFQEIHASSQKYVTCGSVVKLLNTDYRVRLHSHDVKYGTGSGQQSVTGTEVQEDINSHCPLSSNQEISCYGDNGEGDSGDNWMVICSGDSWQRDESIMFKHVDTDMYLSVSGRTFGRPINGQMEVIGVRSSTGSVHWQTAEGVFLHAPDLSARHMHSVHSEL
ncbi:unnamed protein product [Diabrotica balteata]|uniref:MIR domain-containing protein n=1 Tax=Diabrotica balteata TaxID=107213 RepID=A0A9N9SQ79_DIABA|nr:unnamed protein product [Diabrotica balteata]